MPNFSDAKGEFLIMMSFIRNFNNNLNPPKIKKSVDLGVAEQEAEVIFGASDLNF